VQVNINDLCELLTDKYKVDFIVIDMDFSILSFSGHHYGDIILQKVAGRLNTIFSQNAIIARYGGDEFIVISYESVERDYR